MRRISAFHSPLLMSLLFGLCLIIYRFIYSHSFDAVTLSDLFAIDSGASRDIYGLTYTDDSFKYEKTLLEGTLLAFFHGGVGLDIYSIFARLFSGLLNPSVSIILLNCMLILLLYRRFKL